MRPRLSKSQREKSTPHPFHDPEVCSSTGPTLVGVGEILRKHLAAAGALGGATSADYDGVTQALRRYCNSGTWEAPGLVHCGQRAFIRAAELYSIRDATLDPPDVRRLLAMVRSPQAASPPSAAHEKFAQLFRPSGKGVA